ncbi:MAG: glucose-6-phosphate dehydrogenase assembly protein OpcA [Chloroflexi bacterium]|nr:glucose-6-phosphate dehydrogenase assembly protein OpcA [Chloroflexota bacterium]
MAEALTPADTTLTWSDRAVNVRAVEEALDALRQQAAGGAATGESAHGLRTSVLTLVVYAADGDTARWARDIVAALPSHHPSRALIIVARPSQQEPRIDADLSAHCHLPEPGVQQQVCCEQVFLTVRGRAADHLHSVILPLLVPDLPVHLWWTAPLDADPHLFEEMAGTCDRLIVDSARYEPPSLTRLDELARSEVPACSVGDLNWSRLTAWRELIAQFFDGATLRPYLERIEEVGVEIVDSASRTEGVLLAAWLAGRLGWEPAGDAGKRQMRMKAGDGEVGISIDEKRQAGAEAGLTAVRLVAAGPEGRVTFSLRREPDPGLVSASVKGPGLDLDWMSHLERESDAGLLSQQLAVVGPDRVYEEALAFAARLAASR